jgi:hypothetical protein
MWYSGRSGTYSGLHLTRLEIVILKNPRQRYKIYGDPYYGSKGEFIFKFLKSLAVVVVHFNLPKMKAIRLAVL